MTRKAFPVEHIPAGGHWSLFLIPVALLSPGFVDQASCLWMFFDVFCLLFIDLFELCLQFRNTGVGFAGGCGLFLKL